MTLKDNTRQRLYRSERAWDSQVRDAGKHVTFANEAEAVAHLNEVIGAKFDLGNLTVEFAEKDPSRPKDEIGMFRHADDTVLLRPGGRDNVVLAHEVSHFLVKGIFAPSHGGEFCRQYLTVMETVFGRELHDMLVEHFEANKVLWSERDQRDAAWKQVYRTESDWDRHTPWAGKPWKATIVVAGDDGPRGFEGSFRRHGSTGLQTFERDPKYRKVRKASVIDRADLLYVQAPMYRER